MINQGEQYSTGMAQGVKKVTKKSHLTAEKKRRESIRRNFDVLTMALPGIELRHARSEAVVIKRCVEMLESLEKEYEQLQHLAQKELR